MARPYRWLGGIGYILELIPYANLISLIPVAVAWILMGRGIRQKLFTALGILMIVIWFLMTLWRMDGARGIPGQLGIIVAPLLLILTIGLAIAAFILNVIAHFRAGRIFSNRWFRAAGWARIILAVTLIVVIAFMALTVPRPLPAIPPLLETPYAAFTLFLALFWPLAIVFLIDLLAIIFSIVAFFTIPGEAPPAPP